MSEKDRLINCFKTGQLVRPVYDVPTFVDLVSALTKLCGGQPREAGPATDTLADLIGPAGHYVTILVDGMGIEQLSLLPEDSFLRAHLAKQLQAVFLSTTACALTTFGTGVWPATHSIPGWWTYLPDQDRNITTLYFTERATEASLTDLKVSVSDVFPVPSIWADVKVNKLQILPAHIAQSVYTAYTSGNADRLAYENLEEALTKAREAVAKQPAPAFTYVYLPHLDSVMHENGTDHERVVRLLKLLDSQLAALAHDLAGKARIVICADHGLTNVPDERRFILEEDDPLSYYLAAQPSAEPSIPVFHVQPGQEADFKNEFLERFGAHFILITPEDIADLKLMGPGTLSPVLKKRLGSFMAICPEPSKIYFKPLYKTHPEYIGVHGGLSKEEMQVPLIVV